MHMVKKEKSWKASLATVVTYLARYTHPPVQQWHGYHEVTKDTMTRFVVSSPGGNSCLVWVFLIKSLRMERWWEEFTNCSFSKWKEY